jgi:phosphatidate cytidylyltransferase
MAGMLRYRLMVGPGLIAALLALLWLDQWLGAVSLPTLVLTARHVLPLSELAGRPALPPGLVMLAALLLVTAVGARELSGMLALKGAAVSWPVLWLGAAVGVLLMYFTPDYAAVQPQLAWYGTWLVLVLLLAMRSHTRGHQTQGALLVAGGALLGLVYLGTLPGFFLAMRQWHSAWVIAAVVLVTKSCDIGAYFAGKAFGRTKLIPWLSPGKTWEGLIGGLALSAAVAVGLLGLARALDVALAVEISWQYAAAVGIIFGLVGQGGDLLVSLFKRDAGVKDSGQFLPGFGGILDVLDSPLLVAPVAYWLLLP